MRGKEHLVLIRAYRDVLMMHTMHYSDEIRSSEEVGHGDAKTVGASELKVAEQLISGLAKDKFEAEQFKDTYRQKILTVAQEKAAGQQVSIPSPPKRGKVIDLMSALRESLKSGGKKKVPEHSEESPAPEDRLDRGKHAHRVSRSSRSRRTATAGTRK
jgi:DNA end-binding protein Ku